MPRTSFHPPLTQHLLVPSFFFTQCKYNFERKRKIISIASQFPVNIVLMLATALRYGCVAAVSPVLLLLSRFQFLMKYFVLSIFHDFLSNFPSKQLIGGFQQPNSPDWMHKLIAFYYFPSMFAAICLILHHQTCFAQLKICNKPRSHRCALICNMHFRFHLLLKMQFSL